MSAEETQTTTTRQSHSSRALRWTVSITAVSMVVLGLALLYLLLEATNNREYERNYTKLVTINAVAAALQVIFCDIFFIDSFPVQQGILFL